MIPIKLMHAKVQKVLHLCRSVSVWVKNRLTPHMMASARGYSAERLVRGSISAAITHETEPYPICKIIVHLLKRCSPIVRFVKRFQFLHC